MNTNLSSSLWISCTVSQHRLARKRHIPSIVKKLFASFQPFLHQQHVPLKLTKCSTLVLWQWAALKCIILAVKVLLGIINCIASAQPGPKFPNPESQTSLKRLIYLPLLSQVLFFSPAHVKHTLRVMVLLKGSWFPSKLAHVSDSKIRLEWNQIQLRNLLVLVMFFWVRQ